MKRRTIVFSLQIHSSNSSYSSNDVWMYVEIIDKPDFKLPEEGYSINSVKYPMLDGKRVKYISQDKLCVGITLESDKTFYHRGGLGHDSSDTKEFKEIVKSYKEKGFVRAEPVSLRELHDRLEERERQKLRRAGVVLWMNYELYKKNISLYQGGFSDALFNCKHLKEYIGGGGAFGWIGHSGGRTFHGDKVIESGLKMRGLTYDKMTNWISSSSGRHFGDSLEGCNKKEQKNKIEDSLNSMFNNCLIYGAPDHGGMLTDSMRIADYLEALGLLLPSNSKVFNKKQYVKTLSKVIDDFSNKKELNEVEKYVIDTAKEIYLNLI